MLSTIALLALLHLAPAADPITGTWHILGDVVGNPLDVTCTLKQEGEKLSGSCAGVEADGKGNEVAGEIKEGKFSFHHATEYNGETLTITYAGTMVSAKELKGTVTVDPYAVTGEFAATAVPAKE